jgi:phosphatidylethanolamine-binding protein (PEBP) family uncharacterized protein
LTDVLVRLHARRGFRCGSSAAASPQVRQLPERSMHDAPHAQVAIGRDSLLRARWLAPDPPPGHGLHRYVFQIFALEPGTALHETPGRKALRKAVLTLGLASACLIGTFERPPGSVPEELAGTTPRTAGG